MSIDREQQTLTRHPTAVHSTFLSSAALLLGILVVVLVVLGGGVGYGVVVFGIAPIAVAVFASEFMARGMTYFWVVRRWEAKNGIRLKVPPLRES